MSIYDGGMALVYKSAIGIDVALREALAELMQAAFIYQGHAHPIN